MFWRRRPQHIRQLSSLSPSFILVEVEVTRELQGEPDGHGAAASTAGSRLAGRGIQVPSQICLAKRFV